MSGPVTVLLWLAVGFGVVVLWRFVDALIDNAVERRLQRRWEDLTAVVEAGRNDFAPRFTNVSVIRNREDQR